MTDQTKEAWTPGPWHRNIPPARHYPVIFAGRNTHVAAVKPDGHDDVTVEANTNLITAAPELYVAGVEALSALTAKTIGTVNMDDPDWYQKVDAAVKTLRAALAKARGQDHGLK